MSKILIYGVTGFMGELILERAVAEGHARRLFAGGRNPAGTAREAGDYGVEARVFDLDDLDRIVESLEDVDVVLNCAGPFSRTATPLVMACLRSRTHYLDLAGEVDEHLALEARDDEARQAGVILMPGVGFGIVPTEAAAVLACQQLDSPRRVVIAYRTVGEPSRGTLDTVMKSIHKDGVRRMGGVLVPVPPGSDVFRVKSPKVEFKAVLNPWRADLVSVFHSTGVPTITTYSTFPGAARLMMKAPGVMEWGFVQNALDNMIAKSSRGPTDAQMDAGSTTCVAVAYAEDQQSVVAIRGPDAYRFTAMTAVECALRVAESDAVGFCTPAQVCGTDYLFELEGVQRLDEG